MLGKDSPGGMLMAGGTVLTSGGAGAAASGDAAGGVSGVSVVESMGAAAASVRGGSACGLALASGAPPAILDWNNNYGADPDMCVCTHCGNYPKSFIGDTPEISELDVLGEVIGREKCFGAVKGKVKAGPMTYFRLSTDDRAGTVKCYLGEGEFTDDPFAMDGGIAVTRVPDLRKLMRFVTQNGFEHHVAMVRGNHADVVAEAGDGRA